jgi:predicted ATP-grasp superfamily ATP-dependent carboligase
MVRRDRMQPSDQDTTEHVETTAVPSVEPIGLFGYLGVLSFIKICTASIGCWP